MENKWYMETENPRPTYHFLNTSFTNEGDPTFFFRVPTGKSQIYYEDVVADVREALDEFEDYIISLGVSDDDSQTA